VTTQPIVESGMTFDPYMGGHCFYIEKSKTYIKVQDGVKMAEFLLLRPNNTIWVIEAKSSSPDPKNVTDSDNFIEEIRQKLSNGLALFLAMCLKRHNDVAEELPELFKSLDLSCTKFQMVLVINGHKDDWCIPLKDELTKVFHSTAQIWALSPTPVVVLNDKMALSYGLIS